MHVYHTDHILLRHTLHLLGGLNCDPPRSSFFLDQFLCISGSKALLYKDEMSMHEFEGKGKGNT